MRTIEVLDEATIDKIAAGEVVERPASVVKELVENAIDADSTAITVEIRDGGTSLIRITDNGCGIPAEQVKKAFFRHATSKIRKVEDLTLIASLGFRGEALSSISAVSQVELITKTPEALTGIRYCIEGGQEKDFEEVGAPSGSTFLIRNLFYNVPARAKFLKSAAAEGNQVTSVVEQLALSHPNISFKYILNGQSKLYTSGNGNLQEIIYQVFGRDIARELIPFASESETMTVKGFIGKPVIARGNRNFENYFVNGRYVKSKLLAKAIEDGYHGFMMQHRYPFTLLYLEINGEKVDVNVHPAKMELRFSDQDTLYHQICLDIKNALMQKERIPRVELERDGNRSGQDADNNGQGKVPLPKAPEPFETNRRTLENRQHAVRPSWQVSGAPLRYGEAKSDAPDQVRETSEAGRLSRQQDSFYKEQPVNDAAQPVLRTGNTVNSAEGNFQSQQEPEAEICPKAGTEVQPSPDSSQREPVPVKKPFDENSSHQAALQNSEQVLNTDSRKAEEQECQPAEPGVIQPIEKQIQTLQTPVQDTIPAVKKEAELPADRFSQQTPQGDQLQLFDDILLSEKARSRHKIIGQLFDTYWLVEFDNSLYIIDQHAAHEKVLYERMVKAYENRTIASQMVSPPEVVSLSSQEAALLEKHMDTFASMGFEVEYFGGKEYKICAVPLELYRINAGQLFRDIMDQLEQLGDLKPESVSDRLASMACKAAVKGNNRLSRLEAEALIDELLSLENPYNCPHGRPTIISMSKYELEKKFKRIV